MRKWITTHKSRKKTKYTHELAQKMTAMQWTASAWSTTTTTATTTMTIVEKAMFIFHFQVSSLAHQRNQLIHIRSVPLARTELFFKNLLFILSYFYVSYCFGFDSKSSNEQHKRKKKRWFHTRSGIVRSFVCSLVWSILSSLQRDYRTIRFTLVFVCLHSLSTNQQNNKKDTQRIWAASQLELNIHKRYISLHS